jgi:hypothetical protein
MKTSKMKRTKTFKIKYTRISRLSVRGLQSFLFKAMRQVSLNILHLYIYFPVYSIAVVLHACVNGCAPMIGLTRLDLSFLETSESLGSHHRFRIA